MTYIVVNNRRGRPVLDPVSGIELRGKRTVSDEDMAKLVANPAIREMLGCNDKGEPMGSALLTVSKVEEPKAEPEAQAKGKAKPVEA